MSGRTLLVVFDRDAQAEASAIDLWWRENRPAAPNLFRDELERMIALAARVPESGRVVRDRDVRRIRLRRTQYHVYFRVESNALVVLAIWHARRGSGPELRTR